MHFQSKIEQLYDAEPQDRSAIKRLLDETRTSVKIKFDVNFDAIQKQLTMSEEWDQRAQAILDLPPDD